jgi:hypothetical protein
LYAFAQALQGLQSILEIKTSFMKLLRFFSIILPLSFLTKSEAQQAIPFTDKKWTIQAQGFLLEPYRGYNSVYLQNGMAWLKDEQFSDGIIDFDIFLSPRTSFSGMIFRVKDPDNYEELYLRSQQSGFPDAFQYTPVFNNDPAWQLYHDAHEFLNDGFIHFRSKGIQMGYNTVAEYPFDRWLHVRLLVKGSEAELYLDNNPTPVAFIRELLTGIRSGGLGIKSGAGASWFANFKFTQDVNIVFKTKPDGLKQVTPEGTIMNWQVSNVFPESIIIKTHQLHPGITSHLEWANLKTEVTGLLNLSRVAKLVDSANTVFAKFTIRSEKDQLKKLEIGYSDRIKVYCNGSAVYGGNTGFRSRDFRYLGTIGYFDAAYLPLKKGENTITMAVTETFGGWGVMAKWENGDGLQ